MNPERWQQIGDLVEQVLALPAEEREAFLGHACADDPNLRREVEQLLAADVAEPDFLEAPVLAWPDATPDAPIAGDATIGPYRIIRPLGVGGMGKVYLAKRIDSTVAPPVALKLIRAGLDTDIVLVRFQIEQQILGQLAHPNIARLLDADKTEDGRPYFVMEYVDGVPITQYCDDHHLSIDNRLALFQQVCEAVQFAHQNLVVHRDLKPSNLLVTQSGTTDKPIVKLLDFGIAKALSPWQPGVEALQTQTHLRVLTPAYASPEQINGASITTASDIYSLGVLLYELLTGRRPYRLGDKIQSEIIRIISEDEPTRPSTVITQGADVQDNDGTMLTLTPAAVSSARDTTQDGLKRRLRGELDHIVLMALRKEPGRRYRSAADLADDLGRHLNGLPVEAQPDSMGYRVRKFTARYRWQTAAAALFAFLILGFSVALFFQNRTIRQAQAKAEAEVIRADQMVEALTDLFLTADGGTVPGGDTLRVRDFLHTAEPRVLDGLRDQPEVKARLTDIFGQVYNSQRDYDRANARFKDALDQQRALLGPDHLDAIMTLFRYATTTARTNKDTALVMIEEVQERLRRHPEDTRAKLAEVLQVHFGWLPQTERDRKEAMLIEARDLTNATAATDASKQAGVANQLGVYYYNTGAYRKALPEFEASLRNLNRVYEPNDWRILVTKGNIASLYHKLDRLEEAETYHSQVLAARRKIIAANPNAYRGVVFTLRGLAAVLFDKGEVDAAATLYREATALLVKHEGVSERHAVTPHLVRILIWKREYDAADALLDTLFTFYETRYGTDTHTWAFILDLRARVRHYQGRLEEALRIENEAIALMERLDVRKRQLARMQMMKGLILLDMGTPEAALSPLQQNLDYRRENEVPDTYVMDVAHVWVGVALAQMGRAEEARPLLAHYDPVVKNSTYLRPEEHTTIAATLRQVQYAAFQK